MGTRHIAAAYFVLQGVAIALWWGCLIAWPSTQANFVPTAFSRMGLLSFGLADAIAATASILAGVCTARQSTNPSALAWFAAGCVVYASLYCITAFLLTGEAILAALLMTPAGAFSVGAACYAKTG